MNISKKCACLVWGRSKVQIPNRPHLAQCCKWFATASTSTQAAMRWRWAAQTRYTLQRNTASIMKGLVLVIGNVG